MLPLWLLSPKTWAIGGAAALALAVGVQTFRLDRAQGRADALQLSIDSPEDGYRVQILRLKSDRDAWQRSTDNCEARRVEEATQAAQDVAEAGQARSQATTGAFNQGYAAGRLAGRKSCGGLNASSDPGRLSGAGGVQLGAEGGAGSWNDGAYVPEAVVQPGGQRPK